MHVETVFEQGVGTMNEDFHFVHGNQFGVFDGATSLTQATYRNGRTGGFLASNIVGNAFMDEKTPLLELADRANSSIRDAMLESGVDLSDKGYLWSTSAAVVRLNEDHFEWVQIGDCLVMIIHADGRHEIIPSAFNHDLDTLNMWKEVSGQTDAPIISALHDQILNVRRFSNVTYGVLNGEKEAMGFMNHGSMPLDTVSHILLFTDGLFLPKSDPSGREDFDLFSSLYLSGGLRRVRNHIREIEAQDAGCRAYPRFKAHDDIAAISIAFD
jgi:hypothetical protein